nr:hypothetical protein [Cupriavidus sp. amp6]
MQELDGIGEAGSASVVRVQNRFIFLSVSKNGFHLENGRFFEASEFRGDQH